MARNPPRRKLPPPITNPSFFYVSPDFKNGKIINRLIFYTTFARPIFLSNYLSFGVERRAIISFFIIHSYISTYKILLLFINLLLLPPFNSYASGVFVFDFQTPRKTRGSSSSAPSCSFRQPFNISWWRIRNLVGAIACSVVLSKSRLHKLIKGKQRALVSLKMLGEIITRILVLVLGYAYPAFECFKTVEKNRVGIEELRFWCQYWILVAVVTVLERIGDIFVSWLPMYGEMKLALFIYLWYPKTKGSGYVYDTILKPYMIKHETDIDRNLLEFRARAWDLLVYYWENCTQLGQTTFFQALDYLATHVGKLRQSIPAKPQNQETPPAPPTTTVAAPPSPNTPQSAGGIFRRHKQPSDKRRPPVPPTSQFKAHRSATQPTVTKSVQVNLHDQTHFVRSEGPSEIDMDMETESDNGSSPKQALEQKEPNLDHHLHVARLELRRSKGFH